jgi:cell division protein FtsN
MMQQRGGFVLGMVVGLLVGLSLALGVALYITKAPMPFVNKVPPRTAEQDQAEAERNRNWDPNAPLGTRSVRPPPVAPVAGAPGLQASAPDAARGSTRDPAAILAGNAPPATLPAIPAPNVPPRSTAPGADPFIYFVQVGAFSASDEAEQQRARLALTGLTAKVTEREQSGRTVYRVRLGPFDKKEEADAMQSRLLNQSIEARLVRVERS